MQILKVLIKEGKDREKRRKRRKRNF